MLEKQKPWLYTLQSSKHCFVSSTRLILFQMTVLIIVFTSSKSSTQWIIFPYSTDHFLFNRSFFMLLDGNLTSFRLRPLAIFPASFSAVPCSRVCNQHNRNHLDAVGQLYQICFFHQLHLVYLLSSSKVRHAFASHILHSGAEGQVSIREITDSEDSLLLFCH